MKKTLTLDKAKVGSWVYINQINNELLEVRLSVFITQIRQAVFIRRKIGKHGGICLEIGGSFIGIRHIDAQKITVEPIIPSVAQKICD